MTEQPMIKKAMRLCWPALSIAYLGLYAWSGSTAGIVGFFGATILWNLSRIEERQKRSLAAIEHIRSILTEGKGE